MSLKLIILEDIMLKNLFLLTLFGFQLQHIIAQNPNNSIGEIPLYEHISVEINTTYAFKKICTLVSQESMQNFNDLLTDYCQYIVAFPDFNELFNKYGMLYKTYRDFSGKPLTLTIHFGFNENFNFAKELACVNAFKKSLTGYQKEELKQAEKDLNKLRDKLLYPQVFFQRSQKLNDEIGTELSKCNIRMSSIVTKISLF